MKRAPQYHTPEERERKRKRERVEGLCELHRTYVHSHQAAPAASSQLSATQGSVATWRFGSFLKSCRIDLVKETSPCPVTCLRRRREKVQQERKSNVDAQTPQVTWTVACPHSREEDHQVHHRQL